MTILGATSVTLSRYPVGSTGSDGRYDPGTPTDSTIQAAVQPATGRQMETLPEGERQKRGLFIMTESELKTEEQMSAGPRSADRITYESEVFEVRKVEKFAMILPHYEAIAVRLDEATT